MFASMVFLLISFSINSLLTTAGQQASLMRAIIGLRLFKLNKSYSNYSIFFCMEAEHNKRQ